MNAIKQITPQSISMQSVLHQKHRAHCPILIDRQELITQIHSKLYKRVISLVAPLGSGKSTLLADTFSRLNPVSLELTAADQTAKTFFYHLAQAIRKVEPEFSAYVICPTNDFLVPAHKNSADMFTSALNQIAATKESPLIIILDELHHLGDIRWTCVLVKIIEATKNVVWVLSGEYSYTLNLKSIESNGELFQLTEKSLYFSQEEAEFFLQQGSTCIHFDTVLNVIKNPNGCWPYGVSLALSFLQHNTLTNPLDNDFSSGSFTLNLIDILIQQQPEQTQLLLQASVFLERFNIELCQCIMGVADCNHALSALEAINGVLIKNECDELCYRYHPVIHEHLKERFTNLPHVSKNQMISRACSWLIENNHTAEAYRAAECHSHPEFVAELKQQRLKTWIHLSDVEAVIEWVKNKALVSLNLNEQDRLAWCWALSLSGHNRAAQNELTVLLRSVLPGYETSPAGTVEQLFLNPANRTQCDIAIVYVALAAMKAPLSERMLNNLNILHSNTLITPGISARIENILAHNFCNCGDFSKANHHLKLAIRIAEEKNNLHCLMVSTYIKARIEMLSGDLNSALEVCNRFLSTNITAKTAGNQHLILALRAYIFYCGIKPQLGIDEAHTLAASNISGFNSDSLVQVFIPLLRDHVRQERFNNAESILDFLTTSARHQHSQPLQVQVILERFRTALIRSDQISISNWADEYRLPEKVAQCLDANTVMEWNVRENWLMCAILYHVSRNKFSEAGRLNGQLLYLNIECGFPIRYLPIAIMQTWLDYRSGRRSHAFFKLNEILAQAEISALGFGLFDIIPDATDFLADALADNRINLDKHRDLLRNLGY